MREQRGIEAGGHCTRITDGADPHGRAQNHKEGAGRGENGCRSWHWQSVYSRRQRKAHCCSVAREPRPPYDAATPAAHPRFPSSPPLPLLPCLPNTQSPPPCRCPLHAFLIVIPLAVLPCLTLLPCSPGLTYCTSVLIAPPLSLLAFIHDIFLPREVSTFLCLCLSSHWLSNCLIPYRRISVTFSM